MTLSLQATWIRISLLRALRDTVELDTRTTAQSFVYDNPSITTLSNFILMLASGSSENGVTGAKTDAMEAMVAKYTSAFPVRQSQSSQGGGHPDQVVVLLTGSTGGLGCYLLSCLVSDASVARIFALNRPARDKTGLQERQQSALIDHGLDPAILGEKKVALLEGDLTAPNFALLNDVYDEVLIRAVLRIIINHQNDPRSCFPRHTSYTTVIT